MSENLLRKERRKNPMRLKGGKVLIDLSFTDISNEPKISIDEETLKAICEKAHQ